MGVVRTFVAIMLAPSLHAPLGNIVGKFASSNASVKWVAPENTHITLKFLGNVDEERLPEIFSACERAAKDSTPFEIELKNVGCFPDMRRPKVVWLGIGQGINHVRELYQNVESELDGVGFPRENRGFKAHLTIGRIKGRQGIPDLCHMLEDAREVLIGSMQAGKISVMKSKTLPSGPIYTELKAISLA